MDLRGYQELNGKQTAMLWGIDIGALVECKLKHRGLRDFYPQRDAVLSGKKPPAGVK